MSKKLKEILGGNVDKGKVELVWGPADYQYLALKNKRKTMLTKDTYPAYMLGVLETLKDKGTGENELVNELIKITKDVINNDPSNPWSVSYSYDLGKTTEDGATPINPDYIKKCQNDRCGGAGN